jgi:asparagine synthase (glutamine-hydrolysing)
MHEQNDTAFGTPRFLYPVEAEIARREGVLAAWHAAFANGGPRAVVGVEGDFAVGVTLADGRTMLAVDRFGIRSLFYRVADGMVQFAQRADEFTCDAHGIDPQALYDYLYFHTIPSPRTIFRGVSRMPPGHSATVEHGVVEAAPYWIPEFKPDRSRSFGSLREEFRTLLQRAVQRELQGQPPACFLSGGTDSSTIVGMAAAVTRQPVACYSIGFEAEGYDEMAYARVAAKHFGARHHEYYVTPDDLVRSIPAMAAHFDQPFGNSSVLPAYFCALHAKQDGATRMLAGDGGDELFGGNSRYATQRLFDAYAELPRPLRDHVLEPLFTRTRLSGAPLARRIASYIAQARVPMPDRLEQYNLLRRMGPDLVLTESFLATVDTADPIRQQRSVWAMAKADTAIDRTLAYDWRYTLAENDLSKVHWATSLAGIDVGFPMLDDELRAFSQRLRSSHKLRGLQLRWFFKEALRGFLPDDILRKKKHGFGLPFGVWLTRHARLRELAFDSLGALASRDIVRREFIEALRMQHLHEHPGYYGEMVWILMMLEQWFSAQASRARAGTAGRRPAPAHPQ